MKRLVTKVIATLALIALIFGNTTTSVYAVVRPDLPPLPPKTEKEVTSVDYAETFFAVDPWDWGGAVMGVLEKILNL